RKAAVITVHTVWLPTSSGPVSQQPSRKKPVIGLIEQSSSRSPRTLRGRFGRPPPLPLSSLSIFTSGGVARTARLSPHNTIFERVCGEYASGAAESVASATLSRLFGNTGRQIWARTCRADRQSRGSL